LHGLSESVQQLSAGLTTLSKATEGVSARIIARLTQRCEVPAIRAALKEIAADEGRHAAHGWTVVAWGLDEGGRPVGHALLGAIRTLPREMRSDLPAAAEEGGWCVGNPRSSPRGAYAAALAQVIRGRPESWPLASGRLADCKKHLDYRTARRYPTPVSVSR
jgi:hypothetical protein